MSRRIFIILAMLCLLSDPVLAAQGEGQGRGQERRENERREDERRGNERSEESRGNQEEASVSRSQAASSARRRYSGRVLNVQMQGNRWRVRMDDNGTVFNVFVDARNGEVSGPKR